MADITRVEYRELSEAEKQNIAIVKQAGNDMIAAVESWGQSREFSIAKTKIEEAIMWIVKGLTK